MKRKFFSQNEMREIRYNESVVYSKAKRSGEKVYPNHFNASDIVYTTPRLINKDIILEKQNKKPTKRTKGKTNVHFRGNCI